MATEIKAPVFPESVADGTIATWHKKVGEPVSRDEVICDIETDKVVLEVVAPADGSLVAIIKNEGDTVLSDEVIAQFEAGAVSGAADTQAVQGAAPAQVEQAVANTEAGAAPVVPVQDQAPAVRKALSEAGINAADVQGTGRGGRITKEDVASHQAKPAASVQPLSVAVGERIEKRVPMTRLRKRVAERLLAATQQTAMLTTFNEVNMKPIMEMRKQYKDAFEKRHGARLGFMSFFVKAATEALKRYPAVNASIDGDDIVYHGFYDIGVAVSSDRGLVVPILRDTDRMNYAEVENGIAGYAAKAREGKLSIEEMTGSYALAIMFEGKNKIYGVRKDAPLIAGIGDNEYFISSDISAILPYTHKYIVLDDKAEVAEIISAAVREKEAAPGDTVHIDVQLQPYRAPKVTKTVLFKIPKEQREGKLPLTVRGGSSLAWIQNLLRKQREEGVPAQQKDNRKTLNDFIKSINEADQNNDLIVDIAAGQGAPNAAMQSGGGFASMLEGSPMKQKTTMNFIVDGTTDIVIDVVK